MVKYWFIHYFENGYRKYDGDLGTRIADEARGFKRDDGSPFFDHVITYRKADLGEEFIQDHAEHFENAMGAGYWCWKPYIVKLTLDRMNYGDELMYADTGSVLVKRPDDAFALLQQQDVVPFLDTMAPEYIKTKMELIVKLNAQEHMNTRQRRTGLFLIRKTDQSIRLINEWVEQVKDYYNLSDLPSRIPNHPKFGKHQHEQSMWSLLTKLHGYQAYPDSESVSHKRICSNGVTGAGKLDFIEANLKPKTIDGMTYKFARDGNDVPVLATPEMAFACAEVNAITSAKTGKMLRLEAKVRAKTRLRAKMKEMLRLKAKAKARVKTLRESKKTPIPRM